MVSSDYAGRNYHWRNIYPCSVRYAQTNTIEKAAILFPTGRQLAKNLENVELRQLCFLSEVWVGENNE